MVTVFDENGAVDFEQTQKVAKHLVAHGHDGLVVSGTTGESPTTTVAEDGDLLRAVRDAVGPEIKIVAGVGTNDTRTTLELATQAEKAGADGLLLVTPYYNKPGQAGIEHHFRQVADAVSTGIMLYDVPGRTGTKISTEVYASLASIENMIAVKDAAGDAAQAKTLTDLGYIVYSGDDSLTVDFIRNGAVGLVSVCAHAAGLKLRSLIEAALAGDFATAESMDAELQPLYAAIMGVPNYGATTAKSALQHLEVIDNRSVRSPLIQLDDAEHAAVRAGLVAAGLL
jgi:4-hydroxy-tetrahydrodipicolinate synthase